MNNKIVVILMLLLTAGIAYAAEDWNLAGTSTFTGVNATNLNLTYLTQNSIPFIGAGGQVTQDTANFTYFTNNGTLVLANVTSKQIGGVIYADQYGGYNSQSINDAINASRVSGLPVYMPCGVYNITNNIKVNSNQELFGSGNCTILRVPNNALPNFWEVQAVLINQHAPRGGIEDATTHDEGIYIHDFLIDVNGVNQAMNITVFNGISYEGNIGVGIKFYPVKNSIIERIIITNDIGGGIYVYGAYYPGYTTNLISNNKVLFNTILNSGANHSINNDTTITASILIDDQASKNTLVMGNSIQDGYLFALMDEDTSGEISYISNVINNTHGCYKSISTGKPTVFQSNICSFVKGNGIESSGSIDKPLIQNNLIQNAKGYGIKATNMVIQNNQIRYSGSSGIYVTGGGGIISGNTILDSGQNSSAPNKDGISINLTAGSLGQIWIMNNILQDDWDVGQNPLTGGAYASQLAAINVSSNNGNSVSDIVIGGNTDSRSTNGFVFNYSVMTRPHLYENNLWNSPQGHNFGNMATAPTAIGVGDTYFDTDTSLWCYYSTSWKQIADSTTACS